MDIDIHKKKFGSQARNYTKYRLPYIPEVHDLFFALLQRDEAAVLDVACGTGKSTEPLARDGFEVTGVDHDPLMTAEAENQATQKGLPVVYMTANAEELPFAEDTFDAVTVGTAFHWFANERALSELRRVLVPDGLLFVYWTLTTKDVPDQDRIPPAILEKYNWERVPPELRDLNHIATLLAGQGLHNVDTVRLPFVHNDTVEDQVGLMKTASSYEVLADTEKANFIAEITEVLTKQLGTRSHFTYEEEIQVCYGFNSHTRL